MSNIKLICGENTSIVHEFPIEFIQKEYPDSIIGIKANGRFNDNKFVVMNEDGSTPSTETFLTLIDYLKFGSIKVDYDGFFPVTPELDKLFGFMNLPDPYDVLDYGDGEYHFSDDTSYYCDVSDDKFDDKFEEEFDVSDYFDKSNKSKNVNSDEWWFESSMDFDEFDKNF